MDLSVSVIGIGRLGGALAIALSKNDFAVRQLVSRRTDVSSVADLVSPAPEILSFDELEKLSSEVVLFAVPDAQIESLAARLAARIENRPAVFHTSGALSSSVLDPLKEIGCRTGSIHPLVSISDAVAGAENFRDAFFCIEGEASAVATAEKIVYALGGKSFTIAGEFKALYHAAAAMASGHLVALFATATEMLETCGLDEQAARKILLPLVQSTLKNLSSQPPAQALTGPFARADVETIKLHLETLIENAPPQTLETYRQLGLQAAHLAEEQEADKKNLAEIETLMVNGEL